MAAPTGYRYRRVPIARWRDPRVLGLSDRAFRVFEYLCTGPCTGLIPGVFYVALETIAADLLRDLRTVRAAVAEIQAAGLVDFDPEARLFLRKEAVIEQGPDSPLHIKPWSQSWNELPRCQLLDTARAHLAAHCTAKGPKFSEAFNEAVGMASPHPTQDGTQGPTPNTTQDATPKQRTGAGTGAGTGEGAGEGGPPPPTTPCTFGGADQEGEIDRRSGLARAGPRRPSHADRRCAVRDAHRSRARTPRR